MNYFYCMGVPRSGTTYFTHLMNSHENVICGMEALNPEFFTLDMLSEENFLSNAKSEKAKEQVIQNFKNKKNIKAIGDKIPRAYYHYSKITNEFIGQGIIFINIRTPQEVFFSWEQRAKNDKDTTWKPGMNWLIAYLEMIYLLYQINKNQKKETFLINYNYLINIDSRKEAADKILSLLGLETTETTKKFLDSSQRITLRSKEKERTITSIQEALLFLPHMRYYESFQSSLNLTKTLDVDREITHILETFSKDFRRNKKLYKEIIHSTCQESPDFAAQWNLINTRVFNKTPLEGLNKMIDSHTSPPSSTFPQRILSMITPDSK